MQAVTLVGDGEACVCLHPGRCRIATIDYRQLSSQFDLTSIAGVYESIGDAELAVGDRPGFTLSLRGRFLDAAGREYEEGVLYCASVRGR